MATDVQLTYEMPLKKQLNNTNRQDHQIRPFIDKIFYILKTNAFNYTVYDMYCWKRTKSQYGIRIRIPNM